VLAEWGLKFKSITKRLHSQHTVKGSDARKHKSQREFSDSLQKQSFSVHFVINRHKVFKFLSLQALAPSVGSFIQISNDCYSKEKRPNHPASMQSKKLFHSLKRRIYMSVFKRRREKEVKE
jgi:hypothetical protein